MANFNFNRVILGGKIARDPELRTTQSGISCTTFTVAVNRKRTKDGGEPQADFINVQAWRQTAEFITKFFRKGSSICIVGQIQTRSWTDKDGKKQFATEVLADEAYFVDSKAESQPQSTPQSGYIPDAYTQTNTAPTFEDINPDSEELPF